MAKDRAKDARRSVGSHEKMMGALGKAAGWSSSEGYSYKSGKASDLFRPGHGNVSTGSRDYYEHDTLSSTSSLGRVDAVKGIKAGE